VPCRYRGNAQELPEQRAIAALGMGQAFGTRETGL
jgi:hypothetical protein